MGEAAQEREATPEEIEAMQQQVREGMLAGALGFSVANFVGQGEGLLGVKVPSSVATDAERYALAIVLVDLGTGVFQVRGGAPGGFRGPALIAQELARQTGRPAIYNLLLERTVALLQDTNIPLYHRAALVTLAWAYAQAGRVPDARALLEQVGVQVDHVVSMCPLSVEKPTSAPAV